MEKEDKPSKTAKDPNQMRVGTDIIKHLSTTFYPRPQMIFDELITNSRDAMAREVKLHVNGKSVYIEDDGEGMSKEELIRFFYISYSNKPEQPVKKRGDLKRKIIGKFGIGKLSLYQLCDSFDITSCKDGVTSKASFDFNVFESNEFVDDFSLKVTSDKNGSKNTGTRLVLNGLKKTLSARDIKRHLTRTMPLTKDFKVVLSGTDLAGPVVLRSEDVLQGNKDTTFTIDKEVDGVGKVKGTIVYKKTESGDFGIYVRVLSRLVNLSSPHSIVNFSSLTHAFAFARKIYADLDVDGLNDALQTNRAGFVTTHPAYLAFQRWIKTELNKYNKEVLAKWNSVKKKSVAEEIKDMVSNVFPGKKREPILDRLPKTKSNLKQTIAARNNIGAVKADDKDPSLLIQGEEFKIDVLALGEDKPEAIMDKKSNKIIINSQNPLYEISRTQGGVWGVQYHALRAAIVAFAVGTSKTLEDFKKKYDKLVKESEEVALNIRRRIPIIK